MDITMASEMITNLGFPIACVIALAWFIYHMVKTNNERMEKMFSGLQEQSKGREEKLYNEIAECRVVNSKAIETIAIYAEKLDSIQKDVHEIKTDITVIKAKNE